ncbi:DNA polymerase IV [Rhodocytophaga rosea]|uniref:DNA polymerase IV n=1 Tax=Rhodocytophaga rosea TaxID=2704465 RepID=A0A6C0GRX4_9BACT|nr:DNA polymerase IV [Rhodocytophaga rosea]QHT70614.1 DNA polymerase IV [Rhodocytophaga rosea]
MSESVRKIIHIDMDAFYASVEQRDFPMYQGKPLAVGGSRERGVVAAASYEARKFGVRSAMSSRMAYRRCPDLIFVKPRFEVYKAVSSQIREIFFQYTDLVEPLSLDEAFLDVTENKKQIPSATLVAKAIKQQIKTEIGLTASAGISINKFLAKIASDYQKPDGLTLIAPHEAESFVENLEVDKFFGVGKVTAEKMHSLGIHTGADLKKLPEKELVKQFGKVGHFYFHIARAVDNRPVNPNRIRKSVGVENTFEADISGAVNILMHLEPIAEAVIERMQKSGMQGKTLTLKVKYATFEQVTRSKTLLEPIGTYELMIHLAKELIQSIEANSPIRLLGLTISNPEDKHQETGTQLSLEF